jgi:hypothetical protein
MTHAMAEAISRSTEKVVVIGVRDPEWMSYREAYKILQQFHSYDQPKDKVRASFYLTPRARDTQNTPLRLMLAGATVREDVPLLPGLLAELPMNDLARDEDADLRINRKAGSYRFSFVASVALQEDGVYRDDYLRSACDQVFDFVRHENLAIRIKSIGKKCVGVVFAFLTSASPSIKILADGQSAVDLSESVSKDGRYRTFFYRFQKLPVYSAVHTDLQPALISVLYE